jgi:hypothetical protein
MHMSGTFRITSFLAVAVLFAAPAAQADQTSRMAQLLSATDGITGFYNKRVGGSIVGKLRETFVYNPDSSIKMVAAIGLLKRVDANLANLDTTMITYYGQGMPEGSSCPENVGPHESHPAGTLLQWMLVSSDNIATRSIIDYLGGPAAVTQTAHSIGMTSTFMDGYPGCSPNRMTQVDGAKLYEALANGTLLTAASRNALYARTPADGGDSSNTLWNARRIVDELAPVYNLNARQAAQFWALVDVRYKAGNGADFCTETGCLHHWSLSGLGTVPICANSVASTAAYAFGVFIFNATDPALGWSTFFNTNAEPLREPIAASMANWATCSPACLLDSEVFSLPVWTVGRSYSLGTQLQHQSKPYRCVQSTCVARAGSEPDQPGLTAIWQGVAQCGIQPWAPAVAYPVGQVVYLPSNQRWVPYRCITAHLSNSSWRPDLTPTLWTVLQ